MKHNKMEHRENTFELTDGTCFTNSGKVMDPERVTNAFNNIILRLTQNLNLHQLIWEDILSFLKGVFPAELPGTKVILTTELTQKVEYITSNQMTPKVMLK
jgi:hypothetical protein